jgi:hypothetical protein
MVIDADLIHKCADPGLEPVIVEKFLKTAGSQDPLSITVRSGERVVLVPVTKTTQEALDLVRKYLGQAAVRVGVTQYPAGLGIHDPAEISIDLFDRCKNMKLGTALFGKVWRIVWKWYGNPTDDGIMPEVLDDAIDAWKTGYFEGKAVFDAPDPGEPKGMSKPEPRNAQTPKDTEQQPVTEAPKPTPSEPLNSDPNKAAIRIDLQAISGRVP